LFVSLFLCLVVVFSAGTSPIGVKFGRRRRQYPGRSFEILGRYP